ncbi:MAG: hypothetical protein JW896_07345 [Deltaproteobacteria bacterium]|nr:hypothetical protein [Deltaproteobacteria bacterium]
MKLRKKFFIILAVFLLLIVTSIAGTLFYYYTHPDSIKQLITRIVSQSTGMACTFENLSYSLNPLTVKADGINLRPFDDQNGLYLRISDLAADMVTEGRLGRRTLIIREIRIHKLRLNIPSQYVMPEYTTGHESPSFFSRILRGAFTWFIFRDIRLEEAAISDGQITSLFEKRRMEIKGIHAKMNPDHRIEISCNLVLEYPSQGLLFKAPEIHVITQDAISLDATQIAGFLEATDATFQGPGVDINKIETKGTIRYSREKKKLDLEAIEFQFDAIHLKQDYDTLWPPFSMKAQLWGSLNIESQLLNVIEFDLNADDALQLKGKMDIRIGTQTDIRLDILKGYLFSDRFLALLPDDAMKGVTVNLSGPISFQGEMSGRNIGEGWNFHIDLYAGLDANGVSYRRDQTVFEGELSGNLRVSGELPKLSLSAGLKSEQIRMDFGTRDFLIKKVYIEVTEGEMGIKPISLLLSDIHLETSFLRNIHASLVFEQGLLNLKFHGQDVRLIESVQMLGMMPPEWRFEGLSDLELDSVQNKEKAWTLNLQIGLRHLAFENTHAGYFGEALSLILEMNGELAPNRSTMAFRTALTADEGEFLLDRFYLNLNNNRFSSLLKGKYDIPNKRIHVSSQEIQLRDILNVTLEGTLHLESGNPYADFSIKIPKTPMKPLFDHFVLEPFRMEKPFFASFDLAGDISADLSFTGSTSEWAIKGYGWWDEGRLNSFDMAFDFAGINLDLPIWIQTQNSVQQQEPVRGKLFIQNLKMPIIDTQPLRLPLKMDPNRLSVDEPTVLMVSGGVVEVGPIFCENIISSNRSIRTSLRLDGIDSGSLFSQLLPMPVHGTIEGELDTVRFEENTLHSSGQIRAQAFEGEILLSNPGLSGLFSSFPLYKANISIKDINLYELTKGTSFGEIEGILQGHIRDLEIADGQAQKFDLLLESVKTEGINQKISVQAMDNLARIGGGGSPFMGISGAFITLFERLPYSKIGIRASLANDSFRINGSDWKGGPDYLVKSGGIPKVDVVNHNPDTPISFKAMVKRMKWILESKNGPVIE